MGLLEDFEGHDPGAPAGREPPSAGAPGSTPAKKKNRHDIIIIAIGILSVIIAYVAYKRQTSTSTAPTAAAPTTGTGTVAGSSGSGGDNGYGQALQNYETANTASQNALASQFSTALQGLQTSFAAEVAALQNQTQGASGATAAPSPVQSPTATQPTPNFNLPAGTTLAGIIQEGPGGAIGFTKTGAVYTSGTAQYFGGYNTLPTGQNLSTEPFVGGQALAGGGYELTNSAGQNYNFGNQPGQDNYFAPGGVTPAAAPAA